MKKLILSLLFLFIVAFGFAQKFNGGAMIGMAATQVAGDTYSGFNKAGPIAGFFVNLNASERSTFQLELFYIQKGSRKNADAVTGDYDSYLLRLNYIEMPLLYQLKFGWFAIEAGPAVAFTMKKQTGKMCRPMILPQLHFNCISGWHSLLLKTGR